jgi:hypothetical protein
MKSFKEFRQRVWESIDFFNDDVDEDRLWEIFKELAPEDYADEIGVGDHPMFD